MCNEELVAEATLNSYDLIFLAGCPNLRYLLIY